MSRTPQIGALVAAVLGASAESAGQTGEDKQVTTWTVTAENPRDLAEAGVLPNHPIDSTERGLV